MSNKKQAILRAATIFFAEKGFTETSMADLSEATGVAEGTFYYHFGTKTGLFLAALQEVREGIIHEFDAYFEEREFGSGMEMLEEVISFLLFLASHRPEWFLLLQRHHAFELARTNQACREHLEAIFNTLVGLLEGVILRGQEDGSIGPVPTRRTALLLFSMVHGLLWVKLHDVADTAVLHEDLLSACRRIVEPPEAGPKGASPC